MMKRGQVKDLRRQGTEQVTSRIGTGGGRESWEELREMVKIEFEQNWKKMGARGEWEDLGTKKRRGGGSKKI